MELDYRHAHPCDASGTAYFSGVLSKHNSFRERARASAPGAIHIQYDELFAINFPWVVGYDKSMHMTEKPGGERSRPSRAPGSSTPRSRKASSSLHGELGSRTTVRGRRSEPDERRHGRDGRPRPRTRDIPQWQPEMSDTDDVVGPECPLETMGRQIIAHLAIAERRQVHQYALSTA